jgi:hypothetical protein
MDFETRDRVEPEGFREQLHRLAERMDELPGALGWWRTWLTAIGALVVAYVILGVILYFTESAGSEGWPLFP